MDLELKGRRALVTGASRGIGLAIARELAREGARLVLAARDPVPLDFAAKALAAETGAEVHGISADTGDDASVKALVEQTVARLGGLDILVNSAAMPAGQSAPPRLAQVTDDIFWGDVNIKVMGYLRCAREAAPHMVAQGWGRIINISGANARNAGNLSGGARNGALVHMTKTLAVQLGRYGITVNCIHPGTTRTERTPSLLAARAAQLKVSLEEAERQDFLPDSPRGNAICRMVDASEIAFVTAFLASDKSWAVSGELVAATGGAGRSVYY